MFSVLMLLLGFVGVCDTITSSERKNFCFRALYICNGSITDGTVICFDNSPHIEGWNLWYWVKIDKNISNHDYFCIINTVNIKLT